MATIISTKIIGEVREIRRTYRINIDSQTNSPVLVTAYRETLLCDSEDVLISQKNEAAFTKSLPEVANETITLTDGTTLTAIQVASAVEAFIEKWDAENRNIPTQTPSPTTTPTVTPSETNDLQ